MRKILRNAAPWAIGLTLACSGGLLAEPLQVRVGYLRLEEPPRAVLSNLDTVPADLGIAGARLGLADNATTGAFMGHDYALETVSLAPGGDVVAAARDMAGQVDLILADMNAEALLSLADLPDREMWEDAGLGSGGRGA